MVELTWTTTHRGGVSLVAGVIDDQATVSGVKAYRVRVAVHAQGTVWKPKRDTKSHWVDGAIEAILPAGQIRGIGAASPETFAEPPLEITAVEPATEADRPTTPQDILRVLGTPTPPRAALPTPGTDKWDTDTPARTSRAAKTQTQPSATPATETHTPSSAADAAQSIPPGFAAWFDTVETRIAQQAVSPTDRQRLSGIQARADTLLERLQDGPTEEPSR